MPGGVKLGQAWGKPHARNPRERIPRAAASTSGEESGSAARGACRGVSSVGLVKQG